MLAVCANQELDRMVLPGVGCWGGGRVVVSKYLLQRSEFYQTKLEQGNVLFESMRWGWGTEGSRPEQLSEMCTCFHWARRHNSFQVRGARTGPMESRTQILSKNLRQKGFDWRTSREKRSLNWHWLQEGEI